MLAGGFRPYDYVEDVDGWTYLVKGAIAGRGWPVGTVMYSPRPRYEKCKTRFPNCYRRPRAPLYPLAGRMDYIIPPALIRRVFPRAEGDVTTVSPDTEGLSGIVHVLNSAGCSVHLFGSRRLNLQHTESDWDILVTGSLPAGDLVASLTHRLDGLARRFTAEECLSRASRYARPAGPFGFNCLASLFRKTTMYLQTPFGEVGLFFAGRVEESIPDPEFLHFANPEMLIGTILRSGGQSHHLPRLIRFLLDDGSEASVSTILWELGGLEELEGTRVRLCGVRLIREGHWWMGGISSDLEIVAS